MLKGLKWIWNDIKTDFLALIEIGKRVGEGKPVLRADYKEGWKKTMKAFTIEKFLNATWDIFLIFGVGIVLGMFFSSHYYADQAQTAVYDLCQGPLDRGEIVCTSGFADAMNKNLSVIMNKNLSVIDMIGDVSFPNLKSYIIQNETFK